MSQQVVQIQPNDDSNVVFSNCEAHRQIFIILAHQPISMTDVAANNFSFYFHILDYNSDTKYFGSNEIEDMEVLSMKQVSESFYLPT